MQLSLEDDMGKWYDKNLHPHEACFSEGVK